MNGKLACAVAVAAGLAAFVGCATTSSTGTTTLNPSGSGGAGGGGPSSSTGTGASTGQAKAYFESTVYPDLATMPNSSSDARTCGSCHAPPGMDSAPIYLGADAASSYNVITNTAGFIADPKNSLLVIDGSIAHTGPGMNATQLADVEHWLALEVAERGLGGTGSSVTTGASMTTTTSSSSTGGGMPPITLSDALAEYGQCMDYNMWLNPPTGLGLDKLPDQQTTQGPCQGCHLAGLYGNWLSDNPQETFAKNQMMPYVTRQVTGQLDSNGNFAKLVPAQRWILKGQEQCDPSSGQECHPQFTLPQPMIDGINSFVNYTIQQFENGNCGTGGSGGSGGSAP
ncbi:MAG TPA: hypothetical protein VHB21_08010 [Minicystis sp.]|nr:hypothetical protein [Minicystis sp.]